MVYGPQVFRPKPVKYDKMVRLSHDRQRVVVNSTQYRPRVITYLQAPTIKL